MRFTSVTRWFSSSWSLALISFRSHASKRWYSDSFADPIAMEQKRANSASPFRPLPSARLADTEEVERRSWLVNPYNSSRGKVVVIL